ncbi:hypothetical protein LEP1GSC018_0149 [Leptospira kirschneri str. 2008720114]|nr:hypothetical protein LEP1GSC018_0149 [Leptospira kirschneri str. 2008720114]
MKECFAKVPIASILFVLTHVSLKQTFLKLELLKNEFSICFMEAAN